MVDVIHPQCLPSIDNFSMTETGAQTYVAGVHYAQQDPHITHARSLQLHSEFAGYAFRPDLSIAILSGGTPETRADIQMAGSLLLAPNGAAHLNEAFPRTFVDEAVHQAQQIYVRLTFMGINKVRTRRHVMRQWAMERMLHILPETDVYIQRYDPDLL